MEISVTRREWLAAAAVLPFAPAGATYEADLPDVGRYMNESTPFVDLVTAQPSRRLTSRRQINAQPTYHLRQGFASDSRRLALATTAVDGRSALMCADVESGDLRIIAVLPVDAQEYYHGNRTAFVQGSDWIAATTRQTLRIVNSRTLETRMLMDMRGSDHQLGVPCGTRNGARLLVPRVTFGPGLQSRQADMILGAPERPLATTYLEISLPNGRVREIFRDAGRLGSRAVPSPADPDLILIERDDPERIAAVMARAQFAELSAAAALWSDEIPRVWILNGRSSGLTPVVARSAFPFSVHSSWSGSGHYIFHHGFNGDKGVWIGVTDLRGQPVFEQAYPQGHYGHCAAHPLRDVIVADGLLTPNLILAIDFLGTSAGKPTLEILACHNSDWSVRQASHPHCHISPDGRWLSYNRGEKGRSDVCVTRLG